MPTCKSCPADVIFVPTLTGSSLILNAKPEKRVVLTTPSNPDGVIPSTQAKGRLSNGIRFVAKVVDVYTDHHVTCPAAKTWKGRTRKDPPARIADPGPIALDLLE